MAEVRKGFRARQCNAGDDAAGFKAWLRDISQRVAEASKEGSFLGVGGVQVGDAEKATPLTYRRPLE